MKERIMKKNFEHAFKLMLVIFIVLAVFTAVAIPLSLSRQISDAASYRQQLQASDNIQNDDHHGSEREFESHITPLNATNYAIIGGLGVLWTVLVLFYWFDVVAWLYKSAVNEGMNRSLWPILGLFFNFIAVFAFMIVRDRPSRPHHA